MLLPVEVDLILEERGRKKDVLKAHSIGYIKIILALLAKIVVFHM